MFFCFFDSLYILRFGQAPKSLFHLFCVTTVVMVLCDFLDKFQRYILNSWYFAKYATCPCSVSGYPWSVPACPESGPGCPESGPRCTWFMLSDVLSAIYQQILQTKSPRNNDLIQMSEIISDPGKLLLYVSTIAAKLSIKKKRKKTLKSKNACKSRQ